VLALAGVNLVPLLAGAGVASVALGLGAQSLIRDFLSGLFMMLEGQFAVGDTVKIRDTVGVVQELGLRATVLRDLQGQVHYLSNGDITAVKVYEEPVVHWGVEMAVPAARVELAVRELLATLQDLQTEFPQFLLGWEEPVRHELSGAQIGLQTVVTVFPEQQWVVQDGLAPRWLARLKQGGVPLSDGARPACYPRT
jgi:moderate conductance mechanosensitive channel